jgi:exosortase/archaeosortase family protein
MIVCFATIYFSFLHRVEKNRVKCFWLGVSLASAYLVTLAANTIRIIISIYLYGATFYGGWITHERVHRLTGTLIYVSVLVAAFLVMERMVPVFNRLTHSKRTDTGRPVNSPSTVSVLPLIWYVLITIFVPLLNGACESDASRFAEHAALVAVTALFAFVLSFSVALLLKKKVKRFAKDH